MDEFQAEQQRQEEIRRQNAALFTRDEGAWFTGVPGTEPVSSAPVGWAVLIIVVVLALIVSAASGVFGAYRDWGEGVRHYWALVPPGATVVALALIWRRNKLGRRKLVSKDVTLVWGALVLSGVLNYTMSWSFYPCWGIAALILAKVFFFPEREQ
jgi:peptidoglycan/LPS O-acetylase OafA/YrhL